MRKVILTFVILFTVVLLHAQNSVTLKSYQKVGWIGTECVGTDNITQSIIFKSSSITLENVNATLKSKTKWENIMGDWSITFYDYNNDPFELYISDNSFQLTVSSGNITADYTGDITSSQLKELKSIY